MDEFTPRSFALPAGVSNATHLAKTNIIVSRFIEHPE